MLTLTQDQWNVMTTMERNVVVHECIFGVCWHDYQPVVAQSRFKCSKCGESVAYMKMHQEPAYTADHAAVSLVFEQMRKEGWTLLIMSRKRWLVSFYNDSEDYCANAESMPLAICEAALKAKGVLC